MGLKLCVEPGCMIPTFATRCDEHQRALQSVRNLDPRRRGHPDYRRTKVYGDCACCGTDADITRHHVVPLATKNGSISGSWIPMCRPCNSSIGARIMADSQCPMHGGIVLAAE